MPLRPTLYLYMHTITTTTSTHTTHDTSLYIHTQPRPPHNKHRAERQKQGGDRGPSAEELEAEIDSLLTYIRLRECVLVDVCGRSVGLSGLVWLVVVSGLGESIHPFIQCTASPRFGQRRAQGPEGGGGGAAGAGGAGGREEMDMCTCGCVCMPGHGGRLHSPITPTSTFPRNRSPPWRRVWPC